MFSDINKKYSSMSSVAVVTGTLWVSRYQFCCAGDISVKLNRANVLKGPKISNTLVHSFFALILIFMQLFI